MEKKFLESIDDVQIMVHDFYSRVRVDPLIGPIFNEIAKVDWDHHIPKIANFWSDLLLGTDDYRGRPFPPHVPLDLKPEHFQRWLELFWQTIDDHFIGMKAEEAKARSLRIARNFMINLGIMEPG